MSIVYLTDLRRKLVLSKLNWIQTYNKKEPQSASGQINKGPGKRRT